MISTSIRDANFEIKLAVDKSSVYYDEVVEYKVFAKGKFSKGEIDNLKISVIGTISDTQKSHFLSKSTGSMAVEKFNNIGVDITNLDDQILFSENCDISKCIVDDDMITFEMSSKVDIGRKRAIATSQTTLTITAFISQIFSQDSNPDYIDPSAFDGINPFQALEFDTIFKGQYPIVILPNASKQPSAPVLPPFKKTTVLSIPISTSPR